ncbi:hypothetical protein [Micromonospora carbonacea]|uniref:Uncharacterized protein n=1 Tax=Micromonospora carbonacea TaxID=47853 RepID=A0A1C5ABE1_9ACTN|nr:hypothetical protein [Micromonospora carbonacea]SCF42562.1 hypothetical protein GA0070563_11295 [Micromonospora carbonacea]
MSRMYTLFSALVGDEAPLGGVELAEAGDSGLISPPDLARLMDLPQVREFFTENNYGPDAPEEVMYLVAGELESGRFPTLTITLPEAPVATLLNLTPHPITVCGTVIPPTGIIPRLPERTSQVDTVTFEGVDIPIVETTFGESAELPDPTPGTYLVVPARIALAYPHRTDLLMPGAAERDGDGRIVGVNALARVPR